MSIQTQIEALQLDKDAISAAITAKGGTVAVGDGFDDFASDIATIQTELPTETFDVVPTTSDQPVNPTAGHVFSNGIVRAMPTGSATTPATTKAQSTPSISVSTNGLITSNVAATSVSITPTVVPGYVASGTAGTVTMSASSNTQQLSTQAASTITPKITSQIAVTSGKYTTGNINVNPIYTDVATVAELDALKTDANLGKMYRYTGTDSSGYYNNGLYVVDFPDYFYVYPDTNDLSYVEISKTGNPSWTGYYSYDRITWTQYIPGSTGTLWLTNRQKVYFKGTLTAAQSESNYINVRAGSQYSGVTVSLCGNAMSLICGDNFESATTIPYDYAFYKMFYYNTSVTHAPELPATTLTAHCYEHMFNQCFALVEAPKLPATTLAQYCYKSMFYYCNSLTTAPALPATTLAAYCYQNMFDSCDALVNAPALPASSVPNRAYSCMFTGCTSLITAPNLPATTLNWYSYEYMFDGCRNLINAPIISASVLGVGCCYYMFNGCTSLSIAPALPATNASDGQSAYQYMFKGCTSLVQVPKLPITTFARGTNIAMYAHMFEGCTSLYVSDTPISGVAETAWKIPTNAVGVDSEAHTDMFKNCLGTRSTDSPLFNGVQITYYTQNTPV